MLWRIRWEDLQFESPNKYHRRAGSRLTLSQVRSGQTIKLKHAMTHTGVERQKHTKRKQKTLMVTVESLALLCKCTIDKFFWQVTFTHLLANKDPTLIYRFRSHTTDPCDGETFQGKENADLAR